MDDENECIALGRWERVPCSRTMRINALHKDNENDAGTTRGSILLNDNYNECIAQGK